MPEWEVKKIGDLGNIITGNTPNTLNPQYYNGEFNFVSPSDISEGRFISKTEKTLTKLGFGQTRKVLEESILFVCIGSTIGKVAQNKYKCATNQQINSLIPFSDFDGGFIYYLLLKEAVRISRLAGNQAIPIINKSVFSEVLVNFPEKVEQQKIADCLSSLDTLLEAQTEKINTLKTHKTALMQQLFPSF